MYTPFVVITEYSTRNTGLSVWPFCLSCVCQHFWDWESAHLFSLSYLRLNTPTTDIFVYVHTRRHRWTFIRTFDEYMYASICISGRVCFGRVWECICVCVCVIACVYVHLFVCLLTPASARGWKEQKPASSLVPSRGSASIFCGDHAAVVLSV